LQVEGRKREASSRSLTSLFLLSHSLCTLARDGNNAGRIKEGPQATSVPSPLFPRPPLLLISSPSHLLPFATAQRAAAPQIIADSEYVARRVKRHLNDLERTNYTEPTTGPTAYGEGDDDAKGPTALNDEKDASGASLSRF
jgi:hypothetical protein